MKRYKVGYACDVIGVWYVGAASPEEAREKFLPAWIAEQICPPVHGLGNPRVLSVDESTEEDLDEDGKPRRVEGAGVRLFHD